MSLTCIFFLPTYMFYHTWLIFACVVTGYKSFYVSDMSLEQACHGTCCLIRDMSLVERYVSGHACFFAYLNVSLHVANIYMCRYMLQTCVVTYPLLSSMCHDMPAFCLPTCVVTCNYFLAPIALLHFCIKILFYFLYTYIQDRACRVLPEAHHAPHLPAQLHQRNSAREWQQRTPTW